MTATDAGTIEATGSAFELAGFMAVRARTRKAVHMIAEQVRPGMSEEQAKDTARSTLASLGMRRGWHHIIVRCGSNPTKDFMERSEPGEPAALEGQERRTADLGGGVSQVVRRASPASSFTWFAVRTTEDFGWKLNMDLSGHRLSEYPHSAHYNGALTEVNFKPSPNLWVLEIAIAHSDKTFGGPSTRTSCSRTRASHRGPSQSSAKHHPTHARLKAGFTKRWSAPFLSRFPTSNPSMALRTSAGTVASGAESGVPAGSSERSVTLTRRPLLPTRRAARFLDPLMQLRSLRFLDGSHLEVPGPVGGPKWRRAVEVRTAQENDIDGDVIGGQLDDPPQLW